MKRTLTDLLEKNREFFSQKGRDYFKSFSQKQDPEITLLTCVDARVQLSVLSDDPINNIYVVRNIGNQMQLSLGALDYGVRTIKTPLLLILGHSDCKGVATYYEEKKQLPEATNKDIETLASVLKEGKPENMDKAILCNINGQVDFALRRYQDLVQKKELDIVGAFYDFGDASDFPGMIKIININGKTNI